MSGVGNVEKTSLGAASGCHSSLMSWWATGASMGEAGQGHFPSVILRADLSQCPECWLNCPKWHETKPKKKKEEINKSENSERFQRQSWAGRQRQPKDGRRRMRSQEGRAQQLLLLLLQWMKLPSSILKSYHVAITATVLITHRRMASANTLQ